MESEEVFCCFGTSNIQGAVGGLKMHLLVLQAQILKTQQTNQPLASEGSRTADTLQTGPWKTGFTS